MDKDMKIYFPANRCIMADSSGEGRDTNSVSPALSRIAAGKLRFMD